LRLCLVLVGILLPEDTDPGRIDLTFGATVEGPFSPISLL
jgi:hypothetical protein